MYEAWIKFRNAIIAFLYKLIGKPIFFIMDPELIHDVMTNVGRLLGSNPITRWKTNLAFYYKNPILEQKILGIDFKNPIGLAAGFDKDAYLTQVLPEVGFGFEEIGSITGEYCQGNPKPRLWRLKKSKSLVIYYGLKNDGAEKIEKRLAKLKFKIPIGVSVAKTNSAATVDVDQGIADYFKAYQTLKNIGDYVTINISCPNAFGGEPFSDPVKLEKLLHKFHSIPKTKPWFIKMPADLEFETVDQLIAVALKYKVDGFICTNLTKKRDNTKILDEVVPDKGGLSGKVVEALANKMVSHVYQKVKGRAIVIGCGGVFNAVDAYQKIKMGASLIQMITGMIYGGPQTIGSINQGLSKLLKRDGYKNVSEAVGTGHI